MGGTAFSLTDAQQVSYTIQPTNASGSPVSLPAGASIAFTAKDPSLALVVPNPTDPSGLTGSVVTEGKDGTVELDAVYTKADGTTATGTATMTITADGTVASLVINFGTAGPKVTAVATPAA